MLSTIGVLMLFESLRTYLRRRRNPEAPRGKLHTHYLVHRLPLKLRFYKSKLYISALLPIGWASSSACCRRSWASAAASCWCRP